MSILPDILDSDHLEAEYFKHRLAITIIWFCFGILTLVNAIEMLYRYSRGGFYFDAAPIYYVYENSIIGFLSIAISGSIFTKNRDSIRHLTVFLGTLCIFIPTEYISYMGEYAPWEQAILAIGLIVISWINVLQKKISLGNLKDKVYFFIWSSFFGFLPLILSWLIEYSDFRKWLHDV